MTKLEAGTWYRFFGWLAAGLLIYLVYGRTHSRLQRGDDAGRPVPEAGPA
jgi:basic amino acid/polyamine antiporter, APA family